MRKHVMAAIVTMFVGGCVSAQTQASGIDSLRDLVSIKAQNNNVPIPLAHAVVAVESRYNPKAFNQGSYGIGQIRCGTAKGLGFTGKCTQLYDPDVNLDYAMQYLRLALDAADENWCHAVTLYNEGLGSRSKKGNYCKKVIKITKEDIN